MDSPSGRLDEAMDARRLDLDLNWDEVATAAGIALATLRAIRRGANRPSRLTKRRIENALQWEPGSIDAIFAGGGPTPIAPVDPPKSPGTEPTVKQLADRVARLERANAELTQLVRDRMTPEERRWYESDESQRQDETG
jgi:hypothetical protein